MPMPDTPITVNLNETPDIQVNLFSEIALYPVPPVNKLSETVNLFLSKVIRLNIRINSCLSQNFLAQGRANTINIL